MKVSKIEPLEINFSATDRKVYFPYSALLNEKPIKSIIIYNAAQITGSSREKTVISEADAAKSYLVLVPLKEGTESVNAPLRLFNPAYNNGNKTEVDLDAVDWQKSYIYNSAAISASSVTAFIEY